MKNHNYTVSQEAKQGLYDLFAAATKPSRTTLWARKPMGFVDAFGRPSYDHTYRSTHTEGLSHALIQLARNSDFGDWMPNPTIPTYLTTPGTKALFYNPPDLEYLQDALDGTPWNTLKDWQKEERLQELQRKRGWHPERIAIESPGYRPKPAGYSNLNLSLPNDIRRYYHNLRLFHKIPLLPGCRSPHNLTTSISTLLEALGTGHLYPDGAYLSLIAEPNPRKSYALKHRSPTSRLGQRTFGNHAHTPYVPRTWRALPILSQFTQADVDYCYREDNYQSLHDLAEEACTLNPILQLPQAPPTALSPTTSPVSGDSPNTSPARAKPHIDLVPKPQPSATEPTTSTYHYKGRDVTAYVLEAHDRHYHPTNSEPETFPQLQDLADRAQLPLYMLRRLATREYVRRINATP